MPRIADTSLRFAGIATVAFEKVCSFSFLTSDWLVTTKIAASELCGGVMPSQT
jgi:hypothetical protein